MAETVAFAENGCFIAKHDNRLHDLFYGLPPGLEKVVRKSKKICALAIGKDEDYFCVYLNKAGGLMCAKQLVNYPDLEQLIESRNILRELNFHCSMGPYGQFYINNGFNLLRGQLHPRITKEIENRRHQDRNYDGDPVQIAMGLDGAYVIVGKEGYVSWDLQGLYGDLEKALCKANSGVKTIALSPFKGDQFYVLFNDKTAYWKIPEQEADNTKNGRRDSSCSIM